MVSIHFEKVFFVFFFFFFVFFFFFFFFSSSFWTIESELVVKSLHKRLMMMCTYTLLLFLNTHTTQH